MTDKEQFRAHMKAASGAFQSSVEPCPQANDLVAHYRGELDPAVRERLESHLLACPSCREKLRDLADFFDPPRENEEALPAVDSAAEWDRLWPRVEGTTPVAGKQPVPIRRAAPRWTLALAACLVIALSLTTTSSLMSGRRLRQLEAENQHLRQQNETGQQQIAKLQAPRLNASVHDVFSTQSIARSASSSAVTRVAAATGTPFTLLLNGEGVRNLPDYGIEIVSAEGRSLWKAQGLRRGPLGNFSITLTGGFLPPGEYRFRLSGRTDAGYEPLTEYRIAVSPLP